jgi:hypothetical protein
LSYPSHFLHSNLTDQIFWTFLKSCAAAALLLTGALNTSEPIKKPQAYRTRNVKNHLADLDLYLAICCCRGHCVSFFPNAINYSVIKLPAFLTHRCPYVIEKSLPHTKNQGNSMKKKSKVFDIIVLAGMVVNILLAVFLILYYFDFL